MVLAIGVTFQIIEALLKAIDSVKKKKCMIIDQKQITVAENKLLVLKKYVPRNNSPDLPVARNIISQILIVQQYEQETIRRIIVILKKRKSHFSHHADVLNSTKTTTGAEKSRQIFIHLTKYIREAEVWTNFCSVMAKSVNRLI